LLTQRIRYALNYYGDGSAPTEAMLKEYQYSINAAELEEAPEDDEANESSEEDVTVVDDLSKCFVCKRCGSDKT